MPSRDRLVLNVNCVVKPGSIEAGFAEGGFPNGLPKNGIRMDVDVDGIMPVALLGLSSLIRMEQDRVLRKSGIVWYPSWVFRAPGSRGG